MSHYHVTGFPLDAGDIKENEVKLTLFTLELGKIRITVKGTKKRESSLRPSLNPFHEGHYFITGRRTSDLLREWVPLNYFPEIRKDLGKISLAGYLARLVMEFIPSETPDVYLYYFYRNIYFLMQTKLKHDIMKLLIEWGFLRVMGMTPSLESCSVCGETPVSGFFRFDVSEGSLVCSRCVPEAAGAYSMRFGLRSAEYGKKVDMACRRLQNSYDEPAEREEALKIIERDLAPFERREKSEFAAAVLKFSRYHLKNEVADWLLDIDRPAPRKKGVAGIEKSRPVSKR